ncbi:hypothetical protein H0H92_012897 [Tricholoma furcatifolium]|nr:hypothetical protein H0H92_012897 [Tricholoma furcatifolium]
MGLLATTLPTFPFVTQAVLCLPIIPVAAANPSVHTWPHASFNNKTIRLKVSEAQLGVPPSSLCSFLASDPEVTNTNLNSSGHRLCISHTIHSTSSESSSPASLSRPGSGSDSREALQEWGINVESLWRISINLDDSASSDLDLELWGPLTSRMLIWRTISGSQWNIGVDVGIDCVSEWARRQVVRNMAS